MKKIFGLSILVIAFALMSFNPGEDEKFPTIEIGTEIPMMNNYMVSTTGDKISLKEVKGENGTLVIFSCNTCPFVVMTEGRYREVMTYAKRAQVGVVIVNSNEAKRNGDDSLEAMKDYATKQNYMAPYVEDKNSALANAFGAKTTPHTFLFDANDKLIYSGAIDDNIKDAKGVTEKYLVNAIMAVFNGKEVETAVTPAKGCSIKRVM